MSAGSELVPDEPGNMAIVLNSTLQHGNEENTPESLTLAFSPILSTNSRAPEPGCSMENEDCANVKIASVDNAMCSAEDSDATVFSGDGETHGESDSEFYQLPNLASICQRRAVPLPSTCDTPLPSALSQSEYDGVAEKTAEPAQLGRDNSISDDQNMEGGVSNSMEDGDMSEEFLPQVNEQLRSTAAATVLVTRTTSTHSMIQECSTSSSHQDIPVVIDLIDDSSSGSNAVEVEPRPKRQAAQTATWLMDAAVFRPGSNVYLLGRAAEWSNTRKPTASSSSSSSSSSLQPGTVSMASTKKAVGRRGRPRRPVSSAPPLSATSGQVMYAAESGAPVTMQELSERDSYSLSSKETLESLQGRLAEMERIVLTPNLGFGQLRAMNKMFGSLQEEIEQQRVLCRKAKESFLRKYKAMQDASCWHREEIEKGRHLSSSMRLLSSLVSRCSDLSEILAERGATFEPSPGQVDTAALQTPTAAFPLVSNAEASSHNTDTDPNTMIATRQASATGSTSAFHRPSPLSNNPPSTAPVAVAAAAAVAMPTQTQSAATSIVHPVPLRQTSAELTSNAMPASADELPMSSVPRTVGSVCAITQHSTTGSVASTSTQDQTNGMDNPGLTSCNEAAPAATTTTIHVPSPLASSGAVAVVPAALPPRTTPAVFPAAGAVSSTAAAAALNTTTSNMELHHQWQQHRRQQQQGGRAMASDQRLPSRPHQVHTEPVCSQPIACTDVAWCSSGTVQVASSTTQVQQAVHSDVTPALGSQPTTSTRSTNSAAQLMTQASTGTAVAVTCPSRPHTAVARATVPVTCSSNSSISNRNQSCKSTTASSISISTSGSTSGSSASRRRGGLTKTTGGKPTGRVRRRNTATAVSTTTTTKAVQAVLGIPSNPLQSMIQTTSNGTGSMSVTSASTDAPITPLDDFALLSQYTDTLLLQDVPNTSGGQSAQIVPVTMSTSGGTPSCAATAPLATTATAAVSRVSAPTGSGQQASSGMTGSRARLAQFATLSEMIEAGVIQPGEDVLTMTVDHNGRPVSSTEQLDSRSDVRHFKAHLQQDGRIQSAGGECFHSPRLWACVCLASIIPDFFTRQIKDGVLYSMVYASGVLLQEHIANYNEQVAVDQHGEVNTSDRHLAHPISNTPKTTSQRKNYQRTASANANETPAAVIDKALSNAQAMAQPPSATRSCGTNRWPPSKLHGFRRLLPDSTEWLCTVDCEWSSVGFVRQCFAQLTDPAF